MTNEPAPLKAMRYAARAVGTAQQGRVRVTRIIGNVGFPTIEVHISNPLRRGAASEVTSACIGSVTGFGIAGYALALRGLRDRAKTQK